MISEGKARMAKRRVKSSKPAIIPIADWADADKLLRAIGELQTLNSQDENSAKLKIDKVKASLAQTINSRNVEIDQAQRSLEAFAANRQDEFKGKRTRKLNFGIIGWRRSSSISIKNNTLDLIKQVFSKLKAKNFIIIKESVSKDALAKLTDEQLASVGARRKIKDAFFAEPSSNQAADCQ